MGEYSKIPLDTFETLQFGAGFITQQFDPATGTATPYFATTGGITFNPNITYTDLGEDVDNCPKGSKELLRYDRSDPVLSGTGVTTSSAVGKRFMGAATLVQGGSRIGANNERLTPIAAIDPENDFEDLWFVCPYGNTATIDGRTVEKGIAICLKNAFNTTGYQLTTTDRAKGTFAFEFHGHPSIARPDEIPYEVYYLGTYNTTNAVISPTVNGGDNETRATRAKKAEEADA